MDVSLKTITLLALCILVNSESRDPSLDQGPSDDKEIHKISETSPIHKDITLNITICIPPSATDNTKIVQATFKVLSSTNIEIIAEAERSGSDAQCKDQSCKTSPKEPELSVMLFKKVGSEEILVCSTNVTDENLSAIIDAEGREIEVRTNKTKGAQNTARVTIQVISHMYSMGYSRTSRGVSYLVEAVQTWVPTTTPRTTVPTKGRATSEETSPENEKTSHTQESTKTTVYHSSKGRSTGPTSTSTTTTTTSMGVSSLGRGPLSGLILMALLSVFLHN